MSKFYNIFTGEEVSPSQVSQLQPNSQFYASFTTASQSKLTRPYPPSPEPGRPSSGIETIMRISQGIKGYKDGEEVNLATFTTKTFVSPVVKRPDDSSFSPATDALFTLDSTQSAIAEFNNT